MAALLKKVITLLESELHDFEHHLERVPETGRITGFVVSSSFVNVSHEERQRRLWDEILNKRLSKAEQARLGPIVAMTPQEAVVHVDDE